MNEVQLKATAIKKSYAQGKGRLEILRGIDFELYRGDAVSIVGQSGTGKSTFLQILGTLDLPDSGSLSYRGQNVFGLSDEALAQFRNEKLGFVFQFHHLLGEFTARENIMLPLQIGGESREKAGARADELLDLVGLRLRGKHYPTELSGGELQRVAIARALAKGPEILLADEPTGNLDSQTSRIVQDLFFHLQEQLRLSLVVVTHDKAFAERFPRRLAMKDGSWC